MRRIGYTYPNRLDLRHRGSIYPTSHDNRGPRTNSIEWKFGLVKHQAPCVTVTDTWSHACVGDVRRCANAWSAHQAYSQLSAASHQRYEGTAMLLVMVSENMVLWSCFSWRQAYIGQAFRILTGSNLFTRMLWRPQNIFVQCTTNDSRSVWFSKGGGKLPAKPPFKFRASNLFGSYRVFVVSYREGLFTS